MKESPKAMLGVIVGNRGFFPSHLVKSGREMILDVLREENIQAIVLGPDETTDGGVESFVEAQKYGQLFKAHRDELDGILVTLPNFGDEKGIANTIRYSKLNVPILVHAFNDDPESMSPENRRDSFCGKLSVCNNLNQYGIPFSLTSLHTMDPDSEAFRADLKTFVSTCKVVKGLRVARVGAIGARPTAFNTVRYSEKLFENNGIAVETLDLSEALAKAESFSDDDPAVRAKLKEVGDYAKVMDVPNTSLLKIAKLGVFIDKWMLANDLDMTAIQCWTALEEFYGITPCTLMSIMSNKSFPSACETDVAGAVSMYALALASQLPSMLLDWNNNYGDDSEKVVVFHCSNLPKQVFSGIPKLTFSDIFARTLGQENSYGTLSGRIKDEDFTFCRVSTDDINGSIKAYVGEGRFTDDKLKTFGGFGVARVNNLQGLMRYICTNNFEHHVAANLSLVGNAVREAFDNYLGWATYYHS